MSKDRCQGLDRQQYEQIRQNLRAFGTPPLQGELPLPGEKVYPLVETLLVNMGWMRDGLKTRWISAKRIRLVLLTGTDRDRSSEIYHHGGDDGEILAMKENGLDPRFDLDLVTYVSDFKGLTTRTMSTFSDSALLIYAPEALKGIQPSTNRTGSFSNGFHMFLDRKLREPSLLAVFHPHNQLETFLSSANISNIQEDWTTLISNIFAKTACEE